MILEVGKHYQIDNLTKCFADVSIEREFEFKVSNPLLLKTNGSKPITNFNIVKLTIGSRGGVLVKVWQFYDDQTLVDSVLFTTVMQRKDNIAFFSFTVEEITSVGDIEIDVAIHELNASMIRDISNPSHCTLNPTPEYDQVLSSGFYRFNVEDGFTLVNVTLHPQGTILASTMPIGWSENLVMNLDDYIRGIGRNMGLLTPYGFSGDISFTNGAVPLSDVTISWDTDGTGYYVDGNEIVDSITLPIGSSLQLVIRPNSESRFYFTEESAYLLKEANKDCPFDFDAIVNDIGYIEISMNRIREDYEIIAPDKEDLNVKEFPKLTGVISGGIVETEPELVDDYVPYGSELTITFTPSRTHIGGDLIVNKLTMGGIDISNLLENESITIPSVTGDIEYDVEFLKQIDVDFYNKNGGIEFTYTGKIHFDLEIRKVLDALSFYINGALVYSYTEELAQNEKIVGFGSQDGELQIPLNTVVHILSFNSLSYYPIIEEDEPVTDFSMELFQMNGEKNLVDKTKVLTSISTISGTLRESCSMTRPTVTCEFSDVPKFNYVYIPSMRRFYFVTEITFVSKNIYEVSLRVDVLMSYRNQIKSLKGIVARNEFDFNNLIEDNNRSIEKTKSVEIIEGERASSPFSNDGSGVFVLQVVGGTGVFDR